jgi:hypothetical protein
MFSYIKYYLEPSRKNISDLSLVSWRQYVSKNPKQSDARTCSIYRSSYANAFRHSYAKNKMKEGGI